MAASSPALAALFLVEFDQKIGYTITWQETQPKVELNGVEYKSLPSGLHDKDNDVVYFVHGTFAGISAFVQTTANAQHRNARFAAIGALVSQEDAWQYAEPLNQLARTVIKDLDNHAPLQEYWTSPTIDLEPRHPAQTLPSTLQLLGPLLFPLQRQSLLSKRILIAGQPPVQDNCHLVHHISLLSDTRTLYSVGVTDMATLLETPSWTACTTDTILREKTNLYDILVVLQQSTVRIRTASGLDLRATPRDVQHFHALHRHLWELDTTDAYQDDANDQTRLMREYASPEIPLTSIEQYPWLSLAQRSLMWLTDEQQDLDFDHEVLQSILVDGTSAAAIITAYFHKISEILVNTAKQIVPEEDELDIPVATLKQVGLDPWSHGDHRFFEGLIEELTGKTARIVEKPMTLCGIRVC